MLPEPKYPDFVEDKGDLDSHLYQIASHITQRRAQFLFGAGMSFDSNMPTSQQILFELVDSFFPPGSQQIPSQERKRELISEYPFEAALSAYIKLIHNGSKSELTQFLEGKLLDNTKDPHEGHSDFVSICYFAGKPVLDKIYTTNFDLLLEKAFGLGRTTTISEETADKIRSTKEEGKLPVIHLHGVLDKNYHITEMDIFSHDYFTIKTEFQNDLSRDYFVFVGYSMNDPDFRRISFDYQQYIDSRKKGKYTYIVYPAKDYFSYRLGKQVWASRNAVWIPLSAKDFFAKLKRRIDDFSLKDMRERVKKARGGIEDEVLEDLLGKVSDALKIDSKEALVFLDQTRTIEGG